MKKYIVIIGLFLGLLLYANSTQLGQGKGNVFSQKSMFTIEGGFAVRMTNDSGANTIKGYIVGTSTSIANAVSLIEVGSAHPIGIFYEDGIANGEETWIVTSGKADVYFSTTTALHQFARVMASGDDNDVDGHAIAEAFPRSPFATDKHFQEIGHVLEDRIGAGLAKTIVHFN